MKINILTTGGTIEGLDYSSLVNAPNKTPKNISEFLDTSCVSVDYSIEKVFSKDSRFISDLDRTLLVNKINESPENKILITHGTYSMIETAAFLGKLKLNKTIVLVGSFILGTEANSDAQFNLGYAIGAFQCLKSGVFIAMNGRVFSWDNVVKNAQKNRFEVIE